MTHRSPPPHWRFADLRNGQLMMTPQLKPKDTDTLKALKIESREDFRDNVIERLRRIGFEVDRHAVSFRDVSARIEVPSGPESAMTEFSALLASMETAQFLVSGGEPTGGMLNALPLTN